MKPLTMTQARAAATALAIGAVVAYAGAVGLGRALDAKQRVEGAEQLALPSPRVAKSLAMGFDAALADLYFIRALQYYARPRNARDHYRYLAPLLEIVATLDPDFKEPLLWGGVAIPTNLGRENWINTAGGTRLLRLGVKRFPEDWRFHVYLAYNLSTFDHRYVEAAKVLQGAIGKRGAPAYLPALATRLYATGGDLATADAFARAMATGADDPGLRRVMEGRQLDVETEMSLRKVDDAARRFHDAEGSWPGSVWDLVEAGFLEKLPAEPRGGVIYFDPRRHIAMSSLMTDRLVVYRADRFYRQDATIGHLAKPTGDPEVPTP